MRKVAFLVLTIVLTLFITQCGGDGGESVSTLRSVNDIEGATDVLVNSSFKYTFPAAIVESSVTFTSYFIVPTPVVGSVSPKWLKASIDPEVCNSANRIGVTRSTSTDQTTSYSTLTPASALTALTSYTICLTSDIEYATGGLPFEGFQASFTTAGGSSSVTVRLSPVDEATGKIAGTAVTATFSGAITEPTTWTDVFTLKADNAGSSLCTSVTYDAGTLTATCTHAPLTFGSSYTVAVTGITGVTDPTLATFATSSVFGAIDSSGELLLFTFDTTANTVMVKELPGTENGPFAYVQDAPGKYLVTVGSQFAWYISGDFLVGQIDTNVIGYGIMIDPSLTTLDFMLGLGYGGEGLRGLDSAAGIGIFSETIPDSADTGISFFENKDGAINVTPRAEVLPNTIAGLVLDPFGNYYFSQTVDPGTPDEQVLNKFANEDGYTITQIVEQGTIAKFWISNENTPSTATPADVVEGLVYKGYLYKTDGTVEAITFTVTANNGTTITLDDGVGHIPSFSNNGTNVNAAWPFGYYATDDSVSSARFFGINAIVIGDTVEDMLIFVVR